MSTGDLTARIPLPRVRLTGTYSGPTPTDVSNGAAGRIRIGGGLVIAPAPQTATPPSLVPADRYDKAVAYPTPTMVNGRPT